MQVRRRVVLVALALVPSACTSDAVGSTGAEVGRAVAADARAWRAEASTPFVPGPAPAGYVRALVGKGDQAQEWGSDIIGTDAPFTVVAPRGDATDPDAVVVSLTTYGDRGGGIDEFTAQGIGLPVERLEVDGHEARWRAGEGERPALLRVALDDVAALEVSGRGRARERFEALATSSTVDLADHRRAPVVLDPPDGWAVAGSADADVHVALQAMVQDGTSAPGLPGSHAVAWSLDDGTYGELTALTLPKGSVDPAALLAAGVPGLVRDTIVAPVEVGGAPGASLELRREGPDAGDPFAAVVGTTDWGDPVVVVARGALAVPAAEELVAVAEGLRPTTEQGWDDLVAAHEAERRGQPDPGATAVARGVQDGHPWLLQAPRIPQAGHDDPALDLGGLYLTSGCVRFETGEETCAYGGAPGLAGSFRSGTVAATTAGRSGSPPWAPSLLLVTTRLPGATLRVTTPLGTTEVPLHLIPGTSVRVGVVFDEVGPLTCGDRSDAGAPAPTDARLDVVAADGTLLGCAPS